MTGSAARPGGSRLRIGVSWACLRATFLVAAVTVSCALLLHIMTFRGYEAWDDTGSYVLSFRLLDHGQRLYTEIYAPYGPAYYAVTSALFFLLHLTVDASGSYTITYVEALLIVVCSATFVWSLIRSLPAVALTVVAMTWALLFVHNAILYPGLIAVPATLAVAWTVGRYPPQRLRWWWAAGALAALVILVKINLGIFLIAALGSTALICYPPSHAENGRRLSAGLGCAMMIALPFTLIARGALAAWSVELLLYEAITAVIVVAAIAVHLRSRSVTIVPPRTWWVAFAGIAVTVAVAIGACVLEGYSIHDLAGGIIFGPLTRFLRFVRPPAFDPAMPYLTAAALCVVGLALASKVSVRLRRVQLFVTLIAAVATILIGNSSAENLLCLPWIGVFMLTFDASASPTYRRSKVALGVFAYAMQLQIYPVAGYQVTCAALPVQLLALIAIVEALRVLWATSALGLRVSVCSGWQFAVVCLATACGLLIGVSLYATSGSLTALGLKGSEGIMVPRSVAETYRGVTGYLDRECSWFVTLPGIDSYYSWTDTWPPYNSVVGKWPFVLSAAEQLEMLNAIRHQEGTGCLLVGSYQLAFWSEGRPLPSTPLIQYLNAASYDGWADGDYTVYRLRPPSSGVAGAGVKTSHPVAG